MHHGLIKCGHSLKERASGVEINRQKFEIINNNNR